MLIEDVDLAHEFALAQVQIYELSQNLARMASAKTQAVTDLERAASFRAQAMRDLEVFKDEVARVAVEYAIEHDLCDVVNDALKKLGIDDRAPKLMRRAEITFNIEVEVPWFRRDDDLDDSVIIEAIEQEVRYGGYELLYKDWSSMGGIWG